MLIGRVLWIFGGKGRFLCHESSFVSLELNCLKSSLIRYICIFWLVMLAFPLVLRAGTYCHYCNKPFSRQVLLDNGFEEPLYPESISLTNEYSSYVTTYEEYQVRLLYIKFFIIL